MALTLSSQSVSELGRRLRVNLLILQARATLNAVAGDPLVSKALGASFLAKMKEKVERLEASFKDRRFAEDRSREGTLLQNAAATEAIAWRREFTRYVKIAVRNGADVPRDGSAMGRLKSPIDLAAEVERLVEFGRSFAAKLAEVDMAIPPVLIQRGAAVAATLREADAMQEHRRFTERGAAVQRMRHEAVAVYKAVLEVNDRARAVYVTDRKKAGPFNLRILKRGAGSSNESPPPGKEVPA